MLPEAAAGIIRSESRDVSRLPYQPIKKAYVEMVKQVVESECANENAE
jgi:hypothetical protein